MFHATRPSEAATRLDSNPSSHGTSHPKSLAALTLDSLTKKFESRSVVSGISLEIPKSCVFGVIGKSGAGKSTLLRMAALLEIPDGGRVRFGNETVSGLSGLELLRARRRAGVVFQAFNLFSARTAAGNVAFPLEAAGKSRREIRERVPHLLDLVGLGDKANRPVGRLSGGERQRVAIARAIANEPEILFCDEATSALDPETTRSILDLIVSLRDRLGLAVLMVTHQMEVVRRACDRVAVLDEGAVAEEGSVEELFAAPKSKAGRRLLAELMPKESEEIEDRTSGSVYRLRFRGAAASEPLLSRLARLFPVETNILGGTIHEARGARFGELIVEFLGTDEDGAAARAWLGARGVLCEEARRD